MCIFVGLSFCIMRFSRQMRLLFLTLIGGRNIIPFRPYVLRFAGLALCLFFVSFAKVPAPPAFTSSPILSGVYGASYTYNITTTDLENDLREIVTASTLPIGLVLTDSGLGDGAATLTGTVLETGSFPITLTVRQIADNTQKEDQTFTLTIGKATPIVTWSNPASIVYNTPLSGTQLNATADVAGTFAYTPVSGTVLNAGASQNLNVAFTPTDGSNYNSAGVIAQITVTKATPIVSWSNPTAIVYGTPLSGTQLNATASVAGTFAYTPVSGTVLNAGASQNLNVADRKSVV